MSKETLAGLAACFMIGRYGGIGGQPSTAYSLIQVGGWSTLRNSATSDGDAHGGVLQITSVTDSPLKGQCRFFVVRCEPRLPSPA